MIELGTLVCSKDWGNESGYTRVWIGVQERAVCRQQIICVLCNLGVFCANVVARGSAGPRLPPPAPSTRASLKIIQHVLKRICLSLQQFLVNIHRAQHDYAAHLDTLAHWRATTLRDDRNCETRSSLHPSIFLFGRPYRIGAALS